MPALSSRKDLDALTTRYPLYPVLGQAGPSEAAVDADGFVEVVAAPTGFMAIKRGVIERMMAHYPDLACAAGDGNPESRHWCLFDCMVEPETRRYLSEDYAFCRRWRDMGGRIFADVNSQLGHLAQRLIEGDLAYSLTRRGKL